MCFGVNVQVAVQSDLAGLLGVKVVDCQDKCLGLPTFVSSCKRDLFNYIKSRVWNKLKGWYGSLFSQAGKEVLIKAVIQAIPSYAMSCFCLPTLLIKDIHMLISRFWWGSNEGRKKIHWEKWDKLCLPKENGGLGFHDLACFNRALLAKQCWRLIRFPDSLVGWILQASYFPRTTFLYAKMGSKPSFVWRSLLWGRGVINIGSRWRVVFGERIRVVNDPWILRPIPLSSLIPLPSLMIFGLLN
ncbi:hypothetical protein UlMin_000160 [Ulmus minor]